MLVFMLQKVLRLLGLLGHNSLLLCHYAEREKDYGQLTSHFRLLLVVLSFSVYCLFKYSVQDLSACPFIFGEFQAPLIGLEYELLMDPFKTMQRKMGGKRWFWYAWTWLKIESVLPL